MHWPRWTLYNGSKPASEHRAETARWGGADAYRVRLVNALLGAVQTQAMRADAVKLDEEAGTPRGVRVDLSGGLRCLGRAGWLHPLAG